MMYAILAAVGIVALIQLLRGRQNNAAGAGGGRPRRGFFTTAVLLLTRRGGTGLIASAIILAGTVALVLLAIFFEEAKGLVTGSPLLVVVLGLAVVGIFYRQLAYFLMDQAQKLKTNQSTAKFMLIVAVLLGIMLISPQLYILVVGENHEVLGQATDSYRNGLIENLANDITTKVPTVETKIPWQGISMLAGGLILTIIAAYFFKGIRFFAGLLSFFIIITMLIVGTTKTFPELGEDVGKVIEVVGETTATVGGAIADGVNGAGEALGGLVNSKPYQKWPVDLRKVHMIRIDYSSLKDWVVKKETYPMSIYDGIEITISDQDMYHYQETEKVITCPNQEIVRAKINPDWVEENGLGKYFSEPDDYVNWYTINNFDRSTDNLFVVTPDFRRKLKKEGITETEIIVEWFVSPEDFELVLDNATSEAVNNTPSGKPLPISGLCHEQFKTMTRDFRYAY